MSGTSDHLAKVRRLRHGHMRQIMPGYVDLDADPYNPWAEYGFTVKQHMRGGLWKFDPDQVELFLARDQQTGGYVEKKQLDSELQGMDVMNVNVLDWVLQNPHRGPETWKMDKLGNRVYIFCRGTTYCRPDGIEYSRFLFWGKHGWDWDYDWQQFGWNGYYPTAVRKPKVL